MNVKLLRRIQKHILAEPKRLDMGHFIARKSDGSGLVVRFPQCGTVACIAGWAVTLSTKEKLDYRRIEGRARQLLGITQTQAKNLFFDSNWPQQFAERLGLTEPQTKAHARITAKRIDHFLKTKGAE
jgi:hypothetical protein